MKSNKQKCIEMWEWLADHPECDKDGWSDEFPEQAKEIEDYLKCYACLECNQECKICPIQWVKDHNDCVNRNSPYAKWEKLQDINFLERSFSNKEEITKWALEVIYCIENTWEE